MAPRASAFFTPPTIVPVDLELADLGGGGSCPTQFEGHTTDGKEVYVRYRGGGLTIHVASQAGKSALNGGNKVLDIRLGPALDGTISLQQFLRLTKLTVPHNLPDHAAADDELDLSGETSFWRALSLPTTMDGALAVVRALRTVAKEVHEVSFVDGRRVRKALPSGMPPSETSLQLEAGQGLPKLTLHFSRFKYDFPGYGRERESEDLSEKLGVTLCIAGSRSSDLKFDNLALSADFPTANAAARSYLQKVGDLVDRLYTPVKYGAYDVVTGAKLPTNATEIVEDKRISDWVMAEEGHYRLIRFDRESDRYIGLRCV